MQAAYGAMYTGSDIGKTVSEYFTGAWDRNECIQMMFVNIVSENNRLSAGQCGKDDVFAGMRIGTFSIDDRSAFVQSLGNIFTDWLRIIADDHNGFAKSNIFNNAVDHKGFNGQTDKWVQRCFDVKYEAGTDDH